MSGKCPPARASAGQQAEACQETQPSLTTDYGSNAALQARLGAKNGQALVGSVPSPSDELLKDLAAKLRPHNHTFTESEREIDAVVNTFVSTYRGTPMNHEELVDMVSWVTRALSGSEYTAAANLEAMLLVTPNLPSTPAEGPSAAEISEMATHFGTLVTVGDVLLDRHIARHPELAAPANALRSSALQTKALLGFLGHAANVVGTGAALVDLKEKYDAMKGTSRGNVEAYGKAVDDFNTSLAGALIATGLTVAAVVAGGPVVTALGLINGVLTAVNPNWLDAVVNGDDIGDVITDKIEQHGPEQHLMDQWKESGQKLPWRH